MGIGTTLVEGFLGFMGARQASSEAKAANALAMEQLEEMKKSRLWNQRMGQKAFDLMLDENDYKQSIEQMNRLLLQDERNFQISAIQDYLDTLAKERAYEVDRQVSQDKEAARVSALRFEMMLNNQALTADERAFATAQLEEAQKVAKGERDEDLNRYYQERLKREVEREFVTEQYKMAVDDQRTGQQRDLYAYNEALEGIERLDAGVAMAMAQLGDIGAAPTFDQDELDAEEARRAKLYMGDVDRAADRVASVNEANLMRDGLDGSSVATARRGEVTRRIADEYASARSRARDEALAYIKGQFGMELDSYNAEKARRGDELSEVIQRYSSKPAMLRNLPGVRDVTAYSTAAAIPSGVFDRNVLSANAYTAPVPITSAANFSPSSVDPSLTSGPLPKSGTANALSTLSSAALAPYSKTLPSASSFFSNAQGINNTIFSALNDRANTANANATNAWSGFGSSLRDIFDTWNWGDTT